MDNSSYSKEQAAGVVSPPPTYTSAGGTAAGSTPYPPMGYPVGAQSPSGHNMLYNPYPMGFANEPIHQQPTPAPGYSYTGVAGSQFDQPNVPVVPHYPEYGFTSPSATQGTATGGVYVAYEPKPDDAAASTAYRNDISDALEFCEKSIRLAFIRKVYSLLSLQLLVTTGVIAVFIFHEDVRAFAKGNMAFYLSTYIIFVVLLLVLICPCCGDVGRKAPANYIVLSIFTVVTGLMLGVLCAQFKLDVVILAGGSTVLICLGLTLFAFQTKWDFTRLNGSLFVILLVFVIFGLFTAFLRHKYPWANMLYAGIGVLLFSIYLVHDTQLMMGGKHKYALSPEEYIFATLNLYLDIINIFLYLLRLFASE